MKLRALVAIALAGIALALFGPAPSAVAYPVATCSTLSVSTTTPNPGETITVTGNNFRPNTSVQLVLRAHTGSSGFVELKGLQADAQDSLLKTVRTDAQGSFSTTVTLPSSATSGGYDLVATTGFETAGQCSGSPLVSLTIGAANAGPAGNNGGTNGGGGTAFTGVNILIMLIVAGALIGTGVALNRRSNSRKLHTGGH
ncbi:MAG: hypothetical protein ACR2LX_00135 [Jatrophihabitans sp.]